MININEMQLIAEEALKEAKRCGASACEVGIASNKGFTVTAREGDVETVEYHQDKSIDVTVFFGQSLGSASLSDTRKEEIQKAVQGACHIAKFTDQDPAAGLADKEDLAFDYPQLTLSYPWSITVPDAIALTVQGERIAKAYDARVMSAEASTLSTMEATTLYANSLGFVGAFPYSRHEMSCVLVAKEKGDMQRDYSYTVAVNPERLLTMDVIAAQAAERVVKRLGARRLPTMKAPVLFIAEEARGLLGHFLSAISGGSLYRRSSFLLDHLNKPIFPSFVEMREEPHLAEALGSSPFDNDGVLTRSNVFIEAGILKNYCLGVYSARKLGLKTTGNAGGIHNLVVQPGKEDLAGLVKLMGRGLLVTETMGNGVNIITGDYSRGVSGFWVEEGVIQYPVHEITIAGQLQTMYANLVAIGRDVDVRGNIRTGSILLEEMMIAGE